MNAVEVKALFVLTAIKLIRIGGIVYIILFSIYAFLDLYHSQAGPGEMAQSRFFGPYWFAQWLEPGMYLLLSQLFWFKSLYSRKAILILLSLLLIVLPSKRFMYFITNLDDANALQYLPVNAGNIALELLLNCIVFIFVTFTIVLATGKLKNKTV
ncbi:MAG: hypothetical protein EOP46_20575 [Sphingobacteriaceae bacterium]|nr:MAG: hypothetical protein EOP46_20575 [Sphingobacteriaceae bacterium]